MLRGRSCSDLVVERLSGALNEGWDGAVPGLALPDTVKRVRDSAVVETLPRDELVAVQTPQAFVATVLRRPWLPAGTRRRTARRSWRHAAAA